MVNIRVELIFFWLNVCDTSDVGIGNLAHLQHPNMKARKKKNTLLMGRRTYNLLKRECYPRAHII